MRGLIPVVASLYPRPWRERYGAEFMALLEDVNPGLGTAWNVLQGAIAMQLRTWSNQGILAVSGACAGVVFAAMLFLVPNVYHSKAVLRVDSTETPQARANSVAGLARRVESRAALTNIVTSNNLYPVERTRMNFEDVLDLMRRSIKIEAMGGQGSFAAVGIGFDYAQDPHAAQRVTEALSAHFVDQSHGYQPVVEVPSREKRGHPWMSRQAALVKTVDFSGRDTQECPRFSRDAGCAGGLAAEASGVICEA